MAASVALIVSPSTGVLLVVVVLMSFCNTHLPLYVHIHTIGGSGQDGGSYNQQCLRQQCYWPYYYLNTTNVGAIRVRCIVVPCLTT